MVPSISKLKRSFSNLFSSSRSSSVKSDYSPSQLHCPTVAADDSGPPPQPPPSHRRSFSYVDRSSSAQLCRSSSSLSRLSRAFSVRSSKKTCTICLGELKIGQGRAIFVAECSHSFHFSCIASNVRHGSHVCPICRSKWRDIPWQAPAVIPAPGQHGRGRARAPVAPITAMPPLMPALANQEPSHFSDDEPLPVSPASTDHASSSPNVITVKSFTEFPALPASEARREFAILASILAPALSQRDRAPVDLVTVLDISGSMAGPKLSLLKQAVHFVIQNLGPSDRLSIVVFSSMALRMFPLRRMTDGGQADASLAINSLATDGGTNILSGLRKGVRVLEERRERNPVASIILLSDGKSQPHINLPLARIYQQLPASIPVHSFGFGTDHDSVALHTISDASGGTFSFIESVGMVQDAFARCIGGLLSVVAQELQITIKTLVSGVQISSIRSGRYNSEICDDGKRCVIDVGNMYAEEEKGFLLYLSIPAVAAAIEGGEEEEMEVKTSLLDITCQYKDSASENELVKVNVERVEIRRSLGPLPTDMTMSLKVDRHRNRVLVADGIAEAQRLAETGDLQGAKAVLEAKRSILSSSASASAGDAVCAWLDAELRETRERMESRERYEHTGRAYVLSGLSSHSWQRSTTRGDSMTQTFVSGDVTDLPIGYDTPSMVNMVRMSQNLSMTGPVAFPGAA